MSLKRITIPKGTIVQHEGDQPTYVYHVIEGLLRSYAIDQKGKEHIYMFGSEGWVIADNQPPHVPARLFIDALEDTTLLVQEKNLDAELHDFKKLTRRLSVLQDRIIMLMSAPAIDRYEHFEHTYPELIQRVPQRMIASYLGITPQALSKVKSERRKT